MKKILLLIIILVTSINTSFAAGKSIIEFENSLKNMSENDKIKTFNNYFNKTSIEGENLYPYVGYMYYNGIGIEKNVDMAVRIYERTILKDNVLGFYLLGKHLIETRTDIKRGLDYLIRASDGYVIDSSLYIAKMYEEGTYIEKDLYFSNEYYYRASNMGSEYAKFIIGSRLIKSEDSLSLNKGLLYLTDAAKLNSEDACNLLQELYITKNPVVSIDTAKHVEYLICSAEKGNIKSILKVAEYYSKGIIVMINNREAARYYQQYIKLSLEPKTKEEFELYYNAGIAFIKDKKYDMAVNILIKASEGNITNATIALARMYETDYIGEPIYEESLKYYQIAKKQGINTDNEIKRLTETIQIKNK